MPRYLSKSRFKLALECPTKLFYTKKPNAYADNSEQNEFLQALAKGGHQVGALAKAYYPNGFEIKTLNVEEAINETDKQLLNKNVILYEPAFLWGNMLIRVDILVKKGNSIELIEVKSKSFYDRGDFFNRNRINSNWKPYLYDVAFQKLVLTKAKPEFKVSSYLMLADKNSLTSVDGLFQKFVIREENGRVNINASPVVDLGVQILKAEPVDDIIETIWNTQQVLEDVNYSFVEYCHALANAYNNDDKLFEGIGSKCQSCSFKTDLNNPLISGFHQCWAEHTGFTEQELYVPLTINLWDNRRKDKHLESGYFKLADLPIEEIGEIKENDKPGFTRVERQIIQTEKIANGNNDIAILANDLMLEMQNVVYPLHMIDFETTRVAIPFHANKRPYEQYAFQFSHHVIHKNGFIEHKTEWLCREPGAFPNFDFIRALKKALENDSGSVFRYSSHENTVLNEIAIQLEESNEVDAESLVSFIHSITHKKQGRNYERQGPRDMIDLLDWVKRFYYDPDTNGSNSLKAILPSILNRSNFLQEKYVNPIYGTNSYPSKNFSQKVWLEIDENGSLVNPYKQLPSLLDTYSYDELSKLDILQTGELNNGGAAMTAYGMMQFTEMSKREHDNICKALLKYCELDTLAMVMLWEGFYDLSSN